MADINLKGTVIYETPQRYKVELTRGQKGAYGWTITVHGEWIEQTLAEITALDNSLRVRYLEPTPETPTE